MVTPMRRLRGLRMAAAGAMGTAMLAVALGLAPAPAGAAEARPLPPQVLGLIATRMVVPLHCAGESCAGFFSAFCMQEKRPRPQAGQRYDQIGHGDLVLVVDRADGSQAEFSAAGLLDFESEGEYTSVRISLPADRLAGLGGVAAGVRVPRGVALMPRLDDGMDRMAAAGDRDLATGPRRLAAEGFFESATPRAEAAMIMARMINLLPPRDPAPPGLRRALWRRTLESGITATASPQGVDRAQSAHDRCRYYTDHGYKVRLRGCLRKSHDDLLKQLNKDYWEREAGF